MSTESSVSKSIKHLLSEDTMYIGAKDAPDWVTKLLKKHGIRPTSIKVEVGKQQTIGGSWHEANIPTVYLYMNGKVKSLSGHYGQGMNSTGQEQAVNRGIPVTLQSGQMALTLSSYPKGAKIHVPPEDMTKLISSGSNPDDLPVDEKLVLVTTKGFKSFARKSAVREFLLITDAEWDKAVRSLIGKGLLSKSKGITPEGRNIVEMLIKNLAAGSVTVSVIRKIIKTEYPNLEGAVTWQTKIEFKTGKLRQ